MCSEIIKLHEPEKGRIEVARVVVALDAFLFSNHDIQAIVLCSGRRVLMHHFTQVTSKCCTCISTQSTSILFIFLIPCEVIPLIGPLKDSPIELHRSMGLDEWCRDGKRESGRQHFSFTNRAFLGGQVKYRVPLKVPSVHPGHSSSWKTSLNQFMFCVCTLQTCSLFYPLAETTYLVPQTDLIQYHVCKWFSYSTIHSCLLQNRFT